MRIVSASLLVIATLMSYAAPRNPFIPQSLPCESLLKRLDAWQLRGVLYQSGDRIALMNFSSQHWRRVREGQELEQGARISTITVRQLTVSLIEECDGGHYHWRLQGGSYDKANRGGHVADATVGVQG